MIKCPFCHYENEDGALFCERCTSDLSSVQVSPSRPSPPPPPPSYPAADPYPMAAEPIMAEAIPMAVADPLDALPMATAEPMALEVMPTVAPEPPPAPPPMDYEPPPPIAFAPTPLPPCAPDPAFAPPPAVSEASPALIDPNAEPKLVVLRGQKRNAEYPICPGQNFLGRADEKPVDIDLEEQEPPDRIWCSRQHACIEFDDGQLMIEDLNSANGTYVNRTRVYPGQKRPLAINDVVQIGNVQMKVRLSQSTRDHCAPPAPTKVQAEKRETITRRTDVSFPAEAHVNRPYPLRVQLIPADLPAPHPHDVIVKLSPPTEGPLRVVVSVCAENFLVVGPWKGGLIVPREGASSAVTFQLRGEAIGPGRIMLDFTQEGAHVGSVDLRPEVVSATAPESPALAPVAGQIEMNGGPTQDAAAPDVTLKVFEHRLAAPGRLHFVLSSSRADMRDLPVLDGDVGVQSLDADLASWVEMQLTAIGDLAGRPDASADEVERTMADVGRRLYERLLPERFRRLYWALRQRNPKSLMVLSDEPHVPWELIRPFERDPITDRITRDEGFWGETFDLTRWLRGRPPSRAVNLARFVALGASGQAQQTRDFTPLKCDPSPPPLSAVPAGSLEAVTREIDLLRALQSGASFVLLEPRATRLRETLRQGGFDVLHLACHGNFSGPTSADRSSVLLEDGEFGVAMLPQASDELRRSSPLIFFNACHSGRLGFTLLGLGSWGAELIRLGAGAFVGSLWPVRDETAVAFAECFYRSLAKGAPIGEAMRLARDEVRRRFPGDPTWLAYCCFANPLARRATAGNS